ncbi:MAG: biotin/lipoyl-binding protein, partial [Chloroflexota bacterium]|nr:biotin/lipoyl-binding protein [Chloroflexota bacterium]
MKKKWWILIVLLLAGLGYLGYSRLSKAGAASASPATQVTELVVVTRGTLQDSVDGSGNLVAVQEVSLSFPSSGRVAEVLVEEGENVAAGEPLLRLDTANLELNVAREEIALEEAQLRLEQTLAAATGDEIAAAEAGLSLAQANYSKAKEGTSSEQLAQLETDLQLRVQEVRKAQGNYDRYGERMAPQLQDATLNYEQAQLAYDIAAAGPDSNDLWASWTQVESAQAKLDALLAGPTDEEVEAAQLKVEQADLSLKKARRRLEEATLTSPFAGTVAQLNVAEGELAGGTAVVVVSDLTTLDVDV